jgi:S-formylglutathione hydrolase FrmB
MRLLSSPVKLAFRRLVSVGLSAAFASCLATKALAVSTVTLATIPSAALHAPLTVSVYRPDGTAPAEGWPVLYLLHGLNGNCRDWSTLGGLQKTLDALVAERRVRPMVVIMPDAANSWYVDSAAVGGPGDYESALLTDLPDAIEKEFPVRRDRAGRAIAGLSMGGFGALRLALTRPDRFVAVASLSGAIWQNIPSKSDVAAAGAKKGDYFPRLDAATVVSGVDLPPGGDHFGAAFGAPFDAKRFNAANVFTLLANRLHAGDALPAIYLTVGDHDDHGLLRGSIALYNTLLADGVDADFRVTAGFHDWSVWRQSIADVLTFIDSKFSAPAPALAAGQAPASKFAGAVLNIK